METIFVINLAHRTDRMADINALFSKYFNIHRIEAIKHPQGWRGCALSHIIAIETAQSLNLPYAIVVEDDTCLMNKDQFLSQFTGILNFLKEHPKEWDIFHGGLTVHHYNPFRAKMLVPELNLCQIMCSDGYTTGFMIYNQNMYPLFSALKPKYILSRLLRESTDCIDHVIANSKTRRLISLPFLTTQKPSFSDIERRHANYTDFFKRSEKMVFDAVKK